MADQNLADASMQRVHERRASESQLATIPPVIASPATKGSASCSADASKSQTGRGEGHDVTDTGRQLAFMPPLDGLRAIFVAAVVAYHSGVESLSGGFMAVSAFFTLSGFLITLQMLAENRRGRLLPSTLQFWRRRLVRLTPPAAVVIALVVVLASTTSVFDDSAATRTDGAAALLQFFNWWTLSEGTQYGAQFADTSPLVHYWSLSVEEQFYLAFPIAAVGFAAISGTRRRYLSPTLLAIGVVLSVCWPAFIASRGAGFNRLYLGTDTRIAEILIGCALACLWHSRTQASLDSIASKRIVHWLSAAACVVVAGLWSIAAPSDLWLYRGGFAAHAVVISFLIAAALLPSSMLGRVLSAGVLQLLGKWSYAIYLVHWPALVALDRHFDLSPTGLFAVGGLTSLTLAWILHTAVERPFRHRRKSSWAVVASVAVLAGSLALVGILGTDLRGAIDFNSAEEQFERAASLSLGTETPTLNTAQSGPAQPEGTPPADRSRSLRVAVFGDSTALMAGIGIGEWANENPTAAEFAGGVAETGCGLHQDGERRVQGEVFSIPDKCQDWLAEWTSFASISRPDVAWVQLGAWEVADHRTTPNEDFTSVMQPQTLEELTSQLNDVVTGLLESSSSVALVLPGDVGEGHPRRDEFPETDPARMEVWREATAEVASRHQGAFVVDLPTWLATQDDALIRPDGVHFDASGSFAAAAWFLPQLIDRVGLPLSSEPGANRKIVIAGDQVARPIAGELFEVFQDDPVTRVSFAHLPTIPRDETSAESWDIRIRNAAPDTVVVVIERWEALLVSFDSSVQYDRVLRPFVENLADSVQEVIVLIPESFGDELLDEALASIQDGIVDVLSDGFDVQVISLPPSPPDAAQSPGQDPDATAIAHLLRATLDGATHELGRPVEPLGRPLGEGEVASEAGR